MERSPAFGRFAAIPAASLAELASVAAVDKIAGGGGSSPVYVFDFDGVLISADEEHVYSLPEALGERRWLCLKAARYGIDPSLYPDTRYLRHLVFQELLAERRTLPQPGPLTAIARALSETSRPFFVLTARSGQAAIRRALGFMEAHAIRPQETFFVGRVAKGRQLAFLSSEMSGRHLVYFDDSGRHSRNSARQVHETVRTIHVVWDAPQIGQAATLYEEARRFADAFEDAA